MGTRKSLFSGLVVVIAAVWLLASVGRTNEPVAENQIASPDEIALLIGQLGSASFARREEAAKKLIELGPIAREQLVQAKSSKTAEIRSRAAALLRLIDRPPSAEEFKQLAEQPDDKLDVEQGMWLIARIVDPGVRREELTKPLDELAARVRERLGQGVIPKATDPSVVVSAMRAVLFDEEKFTGNRLDYSHPGNSSLARVLATRQGLPITLSHVVVAVGMRLEIPLIGVPTPGRYLVKYDGRRAPAGFPRDDIFLNPYDGGAVLSRDDRAREFPGLDPDDFPAPSTSREVLIRMLNNLETHLFNRDETERAYQALALRQLLEQHAPGKPAP